MAPLALSLGLRPPGEDTRTPVRMEVRSAMEQFKQLPPGPKVFSLAGTATPVKGAAPASA